jgi:hypothetical protein
VQELIEDEPSDTAAYLAIIREAKVILGQLETAQQARSGISDAAD